MMVSKISLSVVNAAPQSLDVRVLIERESVSEIREFQCKTRRQVESAMRAIAHQCGALGYWFDGTFFPAAKGGAAADEAKPESRRAWRVVGSRSRKAAAGALLLIMAQLVLFIGYRGGSEVGPAAIPAPAIAAPVENARSGPDQPIALAKKKRCRDHSGSPCTTRVRI